MNQISCTSLIILLASGSIRWPASHSGLYGFKPTYEVMPMDGIIPSSVFVCLGSNIEAVL